MGSYFKCWSIKKQKRLWLRSCHIGLTEEGLEEYKEVLKATIDYIDLMKKSGYQKHVFNELKSMASLNEIYSSKGEGMYRAINLANDAMMYPLEDVGRINYIYQTIHQKLYEDLVQSLNVVQC